MTSEPLALAAPLVTWRRTPANLQYPVVEIFAREMRDLVSRGRAFHCLVTGDSEMQSLNRRFRRKNATTDVLSFPSHPARTRATGPIGDIAISLARARAQARELGHSTEGEICILMLHGVLHLLGMDHETDSGQMARAEVRWRRKLGLPAGLIERARAAGAAKRSLSS